MERLGDDCQVTPERRWHRFSRSSWPTHLPEGMGGDWDGWSAVPHLQDEWNLPQREAVMHAIESQYATAGLTLPDNWASLKQSDCRVVTVGHQLVMAGGPAFFHHKILTAIRVARGLAATSDRPVIPLFWMASEDHDWKEISTVHGRHRGHSWKPEKTEVPHPVGSLGLKGVADVLDSWSADGLDEGIASGMRAELADSERKGETLSGLMRRWLHRWYGAEGLLVLDPQDKDLKRMAATLWSKEFEGTGVHAALVGTEAMEGPAHVRENNVFWLDDDSGRIGLIRDSEEGQWRAGSQPFNTPKVGWESWAESNALSCSPGVLLRPLYQEFLLQSAAVVLGPGEWKYWHQLPQAFEHHGLAFPPLRLRDHGVVVSEEARGCGWTLALGWLHDEQWDRWVLDRWLAEWGQEAEAHHRALHDWNKRVQTWATEVSPELKGAVGALEASTQKAWKQWMGKLRKSLKAARAKEWAAARSGCASLMRQGMPQDRWANWHILAGSAVGAWQAQWLAETKDLRMAVWVLEDLDQEKRASKDNSSASN